MTFVLRVDIDIEALKKEHKGVWDTLIEIEVRDGSHKLKKEIMKALKGA